MAKSRESDRRAAFEQLKAWCPEPAVAKSVSRLQLNAAPHPDAVPEEMLDDLCQQMAEDLGRFLNMVLAKETTGRATSRDRFKMIRGLTRTSSDFLSQYISEGKTDDVQVGLATGD